ncbi:unnamed protein product, partial [Clonostachys solani]
MAATKGLATRLLEQIQASTATYLEFLSSQSLPEPSFEDGDGLNPDAELPPDVQRARDSALEATEELHRLLLGPLGLILSAPADQYLLLSIQYIYRHKIAQHVPTSGEIAFGDIAAAAGLEVGDMARFLRLATGWHVFHEPRPGMLVHTAASRQLAGNRMLEAWINNIAEEFWPSLARTVDAGQRWPGSEEPNQSGYSLGHGDTALSPFEVIAADPSRQARFNDVQSFSHRHRSFSVDHLLSGHDFSAARTLVDVGGSRGEVAAAIARRYPGLVDVVVQDQPGVISQLSVPPELAGRVRGMAHDFLTPQPVVGADVYLLRWVMHDWSDKYCVLILRALVPALKKGARVVINDICAPEPCQLGVAADRGLRQMDISMKAFNNAKVRDGATWAKLFAVADERFNFMGITLPPGARMAIIQGEWTGEDQANGSETARHDARRDMTLRLGHDPRPPMRRTHVVPRQHHHQDRRDLVRGEEPARADARTAPERAVRRSGHLLLPEEPPRVKGRRRGTPDVRVAVQLGRGGQERGALFEHVPVVDERVPQHDAPGGVCAVDAEHLAHERVEQSTAGDDLGEVDARSGLLFSPNKGANVPSETGEQGLVGVDVVQHPGRRRHGVYEQAVRDAQVEVLHVCLRQPVLQAHGVAGPDERRGCTWAVFAVVPVHGVEEELPCSAAARGDEAWQHVQPKENELLVDGPGSRSATDQKLKSKGAVGDRRTRTHRIPQGRETGSSPARTRRRCSPW